MLVPNTLLLATCEESKVIDDKDLGLDSLQRVTSPDFALSDAWVAEQAKVLQENKPRWKCLMQLMVQEALKSGMAVISQII